MFIDERSRPKAARAPVLIIGLGGTGKTVCDWAYRFIRARIESTPPSVQFLAIDTDRHTQLDPDALPATDVCVLNCDQTSLRQTIKASAHAPELSWMSSVLDYATLYPAGGCAGHRGLGRALFSLSRNQVIYPAVKQRIQTLLREQELHGGRKVRSDRHVEIHVITSVCGGTGAGMLLDLAYALRQWCQGDFSRAAVTVSHLVLPEAFSAAPPHLMERCAANAAATLQEIELFMDNRRSAIDVTYPHGDRQTFESDVPPFDLCFLEGDAEYAQLTRRMGAAISDIVGEPASAFVHRDLKPCNIVRFSKAAMQKTEKHVRRRCFVNLWATSNRATSNQLPFEYLSTAPPDIGLNLDTAFLRGAYSLDELPSYAEYKARSDRWLSRTGGTPQAHLWLDDRWYSEYQTLLRQLESDSATSGDTALAAADASLDTKLDTDGETTVAEPARAKCLERQELLALSRDPSAEGNDDLWLHLQSCGASCRDALADAVAGTARDDEPVSEADPVQPGLCPSPVELVNFAFWPGYDPETPLLLSKEQHAEVKKHLDTGCPACQQLLSFGQRRRERFREANRATRLAQSPAKGARKRRLAK